MAKNKTEATAQRVEDFIGKIKDEARRDDSYTLIALLKKLTKQEARMWGPSIIGFGSYHYVYESGHEGDSPMVAFSPRSTALVLYLASSLDNREKLLQQLGKHKTTKGCVYVKRLADVETKALETLFANHIKYIQKTYPDKGKSK